MHEITKVASLSHSWMIGYYVGFNRKETHQRIHVTVKALALNIGVAYGELSRHSMHLPTLILR